MKKFITLLLAVAMLASILASCATDPEVTTPAPAESTPQQTPSDSSSGTPSETDPPVQTDTSEELNLDLEAIDYNNDEVFFFSWNAWYPEFTVDEEAAEGDPVNEAIYKRNLFMEEELGIKLNFYDVNGYDTFQDSWIDALKNRVADPETPVDIAACYSRSAPYALINGFAVDIDTYSDDLDLDKIWWPDLVNDVHRIKDRLFYISGDASPGLLYMMHGLFMNKAMFKSLGNDYDLFMQDILGDAEASTWTLDKMIAICAPAYEDNDGVAGKSKGDTLGVIGDQLTLGDPLWQTTGYRLFKQSNEDDEIYLISDELAGEETVNFVNRIREWAQTDACYFAVENDNIWTYDTTNEHFGASKALFACSRFVNFDSASMDIEYAVVPFPKYTADQDRFYTAVGNLYTLYTLCPSSRDLDRAAQTLQTMGYMGYKETTPAIFETVFKGQYSKDDYSIAACNIVRASIVIDAGRTFDRVTSTMLPISISLKIATNQNWVCTSAVVKSLNTKIKNVNNRILDAIDKMG